MMHRFAMRGPCQKFLARLCAMCLAEGVATGGESYGFFAEFIAMRLNVARMSRAD